MIDVLHDNNEKGAITKALCRVQARDSWVAEAEANARLIAAAPELLSVLRKIINSVPFGASHHRIQREAIDLMARLL
ncbi:MAG: hypothetical protein HY221_00955 [Candidatus Sungbacteria bacterium]|uniref:Uncharacterized protein n=1 Tax=Candidatus Sungiibacteriota bacterium TaxID=2750080 RepID=A0A932QXY6_9BACT|nr:hypothetical protein [Candidatus Sungbacteria bacterium]